MMNTIIERLAKRWAVETGSHEDEPILRRDARWWLHEIADEIEKHYHPGEDCAVIVTDLRQEAEK